MRPAPVPAWIAIFLLLWLTSLSGCGRGPAEVTPQAVAPTEQDIVGIDPSAVKDGRVRWEDAKTAPLPQVLQVTGRIGIDENRTSRVGSIVEGRVVSVLANVGDLVKEGRVIARITSHDVDEARSEYAKARAEMARRKAELEFAKNTRDRTNRLYQLKAASQEQMQRAEVDVKSAEQSIASAQAEINRAAEHLEHMGLSTASAEEEYAKAGGAGKYEEDELVPVNAPLTGTILKRLVSPGTVVTPASDLFIVSDLTTLWVTAEVPERFLPLIKAGQKVEIAVQAYAGRVFQASVAQIGDVLSPDTRTVQVRCQTRNSDGLLKPEMYATVAFEFAATNDAVLIPVASLQEVGGQNVVFIREGEARFRVRPVRTGRQAGEWIEALEGVRPGEPVVSAGSFLLKSELLKRQMAGD